MHRKQFTRLENVIRKCCVELAVKILNKTQLIFSIAFHFHAYLLHDGINKASLSVSDSNSYFNYGSLQDSQSTPPTLTRTCQPSLQGFSSLNFSVSCPFHDF